VLDGRGSGPVPYGRSRHPYDLETAACSWAPRAPADGLGSSPRRRRHRRLPHRLAGLLSLSRVAVRAEFQGAAAPAFEPAVLLVHQQQRLLQWMRAAQVRWEPGLALRAEHPRCRQAAQPSCQIPVAPEAIAWVGAGRADPIPVRHSEPAPRWER
jgi:hypothetical protein